ncbi:DNA-binding transcriptional activator of the SARP family [Amycolatopsis tolypomycina]|uniref:DNA-binding transcriptional activator of the SARP family n=1 Tax=Amycolatopsis tolypomycina TaxID=208445 RepID=A0A1H4XB96_9PSEU|nr:BTAD domain-containing putative transcriptional regulator [Amycolatopsis tolypomycina]SED03022.1 DNA-binding transcriptional activator of the SARP family [Amycolatopsis tolypomycina]
MRFRILGTLEVRADGVRVGLASPRQQRALAVLLLNAGAVVPVERMIDALWDDEPPATAVKQVRNCVSALRSRLGEAGAAIVTDGPGYRLQTDADELDALRFRRHVAAARGLAAQAKLADAVEEIRAALALWRGPALDGLRTTTLAGRAALLDDQRADAVELGAEWRLRLGETGDVVRELTEFCGEHPTRESSHLLLMRALAAEGRYAEASTVFHGLRRRLAGELGVDPNPELRRLHDRILTEAAPEPEPEPEPEAEPADAEPPHRFDRAVTELAEAVTWQWRAEAELRSLHRPQPIMLRWSAVARAGKRVLRGDLDDIAGTFAALPVRQLVVLGDPGSGKSVLALMLTLELLRTRAPDDPVPVLLSLASWDPQREHLDSWLAGRLAENHPALLNAREYGAGAPTRLVLGGHVVPVLDGLDEMPADLRAAALDALDQTMAVGRSLVLTCRSAEYEQVTREAGAVLSAATVVRLEPVAREEALTYLSARQGEDRWLPVAERLRREPDAALARVLRTPLMVDLVRIGYGRPHADPAELLAVADADVLEGRLLDSFVPNAYAQVPQPPGRNPKTSPTGRYTAEQATRWLGFLARHLERARSRDLAWWQLYRAVPAGTRAALIGVLIAVFFVVTGWVDDGPALAAVYGLSFGGAGYLTHRFGRPPEPLRTELRFAGAARKFAGRFAIGAAVGVLLGLGWSLTAGLVGFLALVFGLVFAVHVWLAKPVDASRVSSPRTILRNERTGAIALAVSFMVSLGLFDGMAFAFTAQTRFLPVLGGHYDLALAVAGGIAGAAFGFFMARGVAAACYGIAGALAGGQVFPAATSAVPPIVAGVCFGAGIGLAVLVTRAWGNYFVHHLWLAATGRLPWRLMHFLDDAHRRGVLRQAGGVYQFRHARVQERLATVTAEE